ncbi:hypothetical protein DdX_17023 [Ditylenchus destructor]|uniref:Uncharacterized protein n=1 Tax=Ditylenchus destructor TaxID=166010 RepID=A0AAD4MMY0_9BILA|nr:hypothetical protein DdX_17023 [Ditylenchus destructor]
MPSSSIILICFSLLFISLISHAESSRNIREISQSLSASGDEQDIQNLIAMLKRNGFTEENELQEALRVLRPEKFGNAKTQQSRKRRHAPAHQPNSDSPTALLAPPYDAESQNFQQSPALPGLKPEEDAPNFASEETVPISPAAESKAENKEEGIIEGVVHRVQAIFSAPE